MERGTHQRITIENHIATVEQTGVESETFNLRNSTELTEFKLRTDFFGLGVLALLNLMRKKPDSPIIRILQNALVDASTGMGFNLEQVPEQLLNALASQKEKIEFTL
jgi:hypothetical protein